MAKKIVTPNVEDVLKFEQELKDYELGKAAEARPALADLHLYPTGNTIGNELYDYDEARMRVVLPTLIEKLDRNDLKAIYRLARVFALEPDVTGSIFEYTDQKEAEFIAWYEQKHGKKIKRQRTKAQLS